MSWSIESESRLTKLEDAIQEASKNRVLLFCSSIDQDTSAKDNTYLGKDRNCIKIGASTGTGSKFTWVSEPNSDFFAPGEGIQPLEAQLWSNHRSDVFGSSVATARAVGLAGVLLYCDRLLESAKEPQPDADTKVASERAPNAVDDLRQMGTIRQAFRGLSSGTENNKFPQVWEHFPKDPRNMHWNPANDPYEAKGVREELMGIMKKIKKQPACSDCH